MRNRVIRGPRLTKEIEDSWVLVERAHELPEEFSAVVSWPYPRLHFMSCHPKLVDKERQLPDEEREIAEEFLYIKRPSYCCKFPLRSVRDKQIKDLNKPFKSVMGWSID